VLKSLLRKELFSEVVLQCKDVIFYQDVIFLKDYILIGLLEDNQLFFERILAKFIAVSFVANWSVSIC
jgi:hypothetical protein